MNDDVELFALARWELFPALAGDAMDQLGPLHQFLPPHPKPLRDDVVVTGRAMTEVEPDLSPAEPPGAPFGRMLEARRPEAG